jgi:hypothetical protein
MPHQTMKLPGSPTHETHLIKEKKYESNMYIRTLVVVSAYARRDPGVTVDSLDAAFFRLSSSSKMSLIDFFVEDF